MRRALQCLIGLILLASLVYVFWLPWVPALRDHNPTTSSIRERREAQARAQGRKPRSSMIWTPLDSISPHVPQAVLLAEDDMFYQHAGFDFAQIKIALRVNWEKKRFAYGGSTITQQLARSLYLTPDKNLLRKVKEALITFWMEQTLTKKRILELYLNVVEWGPGIYGVEAASRHYFEKQSSELTPDEAVALASILPSPRRWSPLSERAFMARRRTNLLERMRRAGYLPEVLEESEVAVDPEALMGAATEPVMIP